VVFTIIIRDLIHKVNVTVTKVRKKYIFLCFIIMLKCGMGCMEKGCWSTNSITNGCIACATSIAERSDEYHNIRLVVMCHRRITQMSPRDDSELVERYEPDLRALLVGNTMRARLAAGNPLVRKSGIPRAKGVVRIQMPRRLPVVPDETIYGVRFLDGNLNRLACTVVGDFTSLEDPLSVCEAALLWAFVMRRGMVQHRHWPLVDRPPTTFFRNTGLSFEGFSEGTMCAFYHEVFYAQLCEDFEVSIMVMCVVGRQPALSQVELEEFCAAVREDMAAWRRRVEL